MTIRLFLPALAATLALVAGAALAEHVPLTDPAKEAEIRSVMEGRGFEVRDLGSLGDMATPEGRYEVYGVKDGTAYEIFLDQSLCIVDFAVAA